MANHERIELSDSNEVVYISFEKARYRFIHSLAAVACRGNDSKNAFHEAASVNRSRHELPGNVGNVYLND